MRMRGLCLLLLGLLLVSNGPPGGKAAETCPVPDAGGEDGLEESINDTLEAMETATEKLMEDMKTLDLHLRAEAGEEGTKEAGEAAGQAQGGAAEDLEKEIEMLEALAGSDEGKELYDQLQKLNEQLEKAGVKAFGDLEEGSYRREGGKGDWVVPALKEDIEACQAELQMQEQEAAAAAVEAGAADGAGDAGGEAGDAGGEAGDGAELYAELSKLNSELEAAGVKAFGDLEEGTYRRGGQGEWVVEALREDIEACKAELAMQEQEKASSDGGRGEEGKADECKACDELEEDIKEAEDEGAKLFAELKELNPLVKEEIYFRNGEWRLDTLRYDIQACSGEDGECEAPGGEGGEEGKNVEEGKEERMKKMADLFGTQTLQDNMASEEHKTEPEGVAGGGAADDDAGCGS